MQTGEERRHSDRGPGLSASWKRRPLHTIRLSMLTDSRCGALRRLVRIGETKRFSLHAIRRVENTLL